MTSGHDQSTPTRSVQHRTVLLWSVSSFVVVLLAIVGLRLALLTHGSPANSTDGLGAADDRGANEAPPGAEEDRSAVVYDPQDQGREDVPNDDRPIFWTYAQFQILADIATGGASEPAADQWMIDDQILSSSEVETYIADHRQSIRQQGGLEFVCYNAEYLKGVQGRLESWTVDASSNDWVELNRIPKAVAEQFTAGKVFPAPTSTDYQQCAHTVDHWNTLMGA